MADSLHHAYLLVGERSSAEAFLHSFWVENGATLTGSPDYFLFTEELFGIDEARKLTVAAARKAFGERKIFFIAPERVSIEAQNALLKTFEDPYENTHFFLVVREEGLIIPTLRSRMQIMRPAHTGQSSALTSDAEKFLSLGLKERMAFAKKFADADLPAGRQGKNLSVFLDELLLLLRAKGSTEPLKKVYEARRYSDDRAASARLILEHLSLVL
ncbi:MAG: hypothetical protein NUV78_01680 [Candidatus Zambryskibacteria bacterium]|nr:hypothetical protein [Candidatus Zambryskibacteria bacterium]